MVIATSIGNHHKLTGDCHLRSNNHHMQWVLATVTKLWRSLFFVYTRTAENWTAKNREKSVKQIKKASLEAIWTYQLDHSVTEYCDLQLDFKPLWIKGRKTQERWKTLLVWRFRILCVFRLLTDLLDCKGWILERLWVLCDCGKMRERDFVWERVENSYRERPYLSSRRGRVKDN